MKTLLDSLKKSAKEVCEAEGLKNKSKIQPFRMTQEPII
jgi:hypothetical protein